MVVHGLAVNLPWLAFVNASFALMVLLRNSLFGHIDALLHISPPLRQMIDASMLGVVILSVALVIMAWRHIRGVSVVLFMCSLLWSISCYWFINVLHLPHPRLYSLPC